MKSHIPGGQKIDGLVEQRPPLESSPGLNVVDPLQLAQELAPGHSAVSVTVDIGLKYLAGELHAI